MTTLFSKTDTFLGMYSQWDEADWIYFGIPMDFTVSFQPGSRFGPSRVREASYAIETYSLAQDRDLEAIKVHDAGEVELPFGNVTESLERIHQAAWSVISADKRFFALGGEHLVSLPLVQALVKRYPDLVIVHFDAHADLRQDYMGETLSHATVMRRICEWIKPGNLYQFGIRSGTRDEVQFAREFGHLYPHEVLDPLKHVLPELQGRPVYVTIDIDVIDPAFMPGTGTPEPGGISSREALEAVRLLKGLHVVSMDLVETMPAYDLSQRSAVLAAKLVREALLAIG
ncbi:agmatinase [Sulfobacillus thermosulfidooxidans]|uniref:agmatinase n=1 Tax=Sulfobacillus thermosulfidooxidans TaxID=28034 RepID=UPI000AF83C46|nr:agmatinase [Sulfobacillus thermosulfidooxidans]